MLAGGGARLQVCLPRDLPALRRSFEIGGCARPFLYIGFLPPVEKLASGIHKCLFEKILDAIVTRVLMVG